MVGISEIEYLLWKSSPQYCQAYKDGYEQAKREMKQMLEQMQAIYETSNINNE